MTFQPCSQGISMDKGMFSQLEMLEWLSNYMGEQWAIHLFVVYKCIQDYWSKHKNKITSLLEENIEKISLSYREMKNKNNIVNKSKVVKMNFIKIKPCDFWDRIRKASKWSYSLGENMWNGLSNTGLLFSSYNSTIKEQMIQLKNWVGPSQRSQGEGSPAHDTGSVIMSQYRTTGHSGRHPCKWPKRNRVLTPKVENNTQNKTGLLHCWWVRGMAWSLWTRD